jgi:RNA-directed DNA polymerase
LVQSLSLSSKANPSRRVWIPKPGNPSEKRPLAIPTIANCALQVLVKLALEPEWEALFEPNSYGFRPDRSAHDAIEAIFNAVSLKAKFLLDADISKCFDQIDHRGLLTKLNTAPTFHRLIKGWLKAGVLEAGHWIPSHAGSSQGSVISPLYSSIYLNLLDRVWQTRGYREQLGATLHRYADDVVLVCRKSATQALEAFESITTRMGLTINREKTRITKITEGFDFIGFPFSFLRVLSPVSNCSMRSCWRFSCPSNCSMVCCC